MPMLRPIPRRWSQFTGGLSTAARKRAMTNQPIKVRTCQSRKSPASTTAAVRRAMAIVRTTCEGAMRTHTVSSSPGMGRLGPAGWLGPAGCVCATLCSLLSSPDAGVLGFVGSVCGVLCSPVSPVPSLAGSVCESLRSPVFPLSSLIPSPQVHSGSRRSYYTTSTCERQSRRGAQTPPYQVQITLKALCCAFLRSVLTSITFHSGDLGDLVPLGVAGRPVADVEQPGQNHPEPLPAGHPDSGCVEKHVDQGRKGEEDDAEQRPDERVECCIDEGGPQNPDNE